MPNFMDRIYAGLLGQPTNYGGILDPAAEAQARRDGQMAIPAALLAASGWSDRPTTLGQAVGNAMMAGRQTQNDSLQAALQAQLLKSQITRNERDQLTTGQREYEYAKANGYKGTFEDWKQITQQESRPTAPIQEYNLYATQEKAAGRVPLEYYPWLEKRARLNVGAPYTQAEQGGEKGAFDRRSGQFTPNTSLDQEVNAANALASATASGTAFGKAAGEISGGILKKGSDAKGAQRVLDGADTLIDIATGSGAGNLRDKFAGFFGYSTDGATALAELKVLQANLMLQQPRMEGPQSDRDVQLYREAAASLGEPDVPAAQKKAALRQIIELQNKYMERADSDAPVPSRQSPRTPNNPKAKTAAERAAEMGL